MEMKISEIKLGNNIRKDFGDITELSENIKNNGIFLDLVVTKDNILVAGYRRLEAAKLAGLDSVPVKILDIDSKDKDAIQIIENVQRKDLTIVEEAYAYKNFMVAHKLKVAEFAKKINKSEDYINKRLTVINNLSENILKDLKENKIQLGHALLLAKFAKGDAEKFLKEINSKNYSVAAAKSALEYSELAANLKEAPFDTMECKKCNHNGSFQSNLFETGKTLEGNCLNHGCFNKKVADFVKNLKKDYKDVLVTDSKYAWNTPAGFIEKDSWDAKEKGIIPKFVEKCRKDMNKENYLVFVADNGKIREFFKIQKTPERKSMNNNAQEFASTRKANIYVSAKDWRRNFLIDNSKKLMLEGKDNFKTVKSLVLHHLLEKDHTNSDRAEEYGVDRFNKNKMNNLLLLSEKKTDELITILASELFSELHENKDIEQFAKLFGFSYEKHFVLEESYLDIFQKDDLLKIAEDLKIELKTTESRKDMMGHILQTWKALNADNPGTVPKIFLEN